MTHHPDANAPRECGRLFTPLSSSGLTGQPSIPEAVVLELKRLWNTGSFAFADDDTE